MSVVSNHFPECIPQTEAMSPEERARYEAEFADVVAVLPEADQGDADPDADPDRPEPPEPTEAQITAMGEAAGGLLRRTGRNPCPRPRPHRSFRVLCPATALNPSTSVEITIQTSPRRFQSIWSWITPMPADFGR
jgi:hypothetical protein